MVRVTAGEHVQWRRVDPAYSYCSSNDPRVHFGLGDATEVEVLVRWPDGAETGFGARAVGTYHGLARPAE